VREER
jgi:hypothetical protein